MSTGISIIKPLGYQRSKECGYCKKSSGSCSYFLACDNMRPDHYQELIDRGWRRSGSTYYKQDLLRSCCPHYTMRLKASEFKSKREQRSAINKFNKYVTGPEYRRKIAMLAPQTREAKRQKRDLFELRDEVHRAEYSQLARPVGKKTQKPIEPDHRFDVTLEADTCTKEKHRIFLRYQTRIHQDPEWRWKESSFKRFLCNGLDRKILKIRGKTMKIGTYHQCYRLDGKLVAVGVLDLLPHAVSSVYLFYDPDYEEWDWGKMTALHEIALADEGGYQYYYMGFYIHSCIKMRYKGRFEPSYLLDPESLDWNRLDDDYRKGLDQRQYISPSRDRRIGPDAVAAEIGNETNGQTLKVGSLAIDENTKGKSATESKGDDTLEIDSDLSDVDETEIPEGSLFEYNIPGVLTKDDISKLDLDHMKLLVRNTLVDLEDLSGWEQWRIDDPSSIKGIAAELIAVTGPALLHDSAMALF